MGWRNLVAHGAEGSCFLDVVGDVYITVGPILTCQCEQIANAALNSGLLVCMLITLCRLLMHLQNCASVITMLHLCRYGVTTWC